MTTTKLFPTADVLSTITGRLVSPNGIGGVYQVLNFMTGESVYTHQIPRISREAEPVLIAVPTMGVAEHESIDPLSELTEKIHPDRVVVIDASKS